MKKNLTSIISHSSTDRQKWEGGMAHKWERGGLVGKEMDYFIFYLHVYATNSMANVIIYLKLRSHTKCYWEDNIDNNCPYTIYRCSIYFSILDCKVLHEKNDHLQYCAKGDMCYWWKEAEPEWSLKLLHLRKTQNINSVISVLTYFTIKTVIASTYKSITTRNPNGTQNIEQEKSNRHYNGTHIFFSFFFFFAMSLTRRNIIELPIFMEKTFLTFLLRNTFKICFLVDIY